MWLTHVAYRDRELVGKRLELKDEDTLYLLGPNLTLRECTLVLRVPSKRLVVSGVRFIDCAIEMKEALKSFCWCSAHLRGCRFTGRLEGYVVDTFRWSPPECVAVTFSAARLAEEYGVGQDVLRAALERVQG